MLVARAAVFPDLILAIHILAVVIAFGATFAYPLFFSAARKLDPTVMPWLFRTLRMVSRRIINPGLAVVLLAGIYLASDKHQWSSFFVQWGIGAVVVIGAIEGSFMSPREGKLAELSQRDLAATAVAAGGTRQSATWSPEFEATFKQLATGGTVLNAIVVITVFLMATHAGG